MERVKVLHLTSTRYGIGGVERLLIDLSGKFDAGRFDVSYCNLFSDSDDGGDFPNELSKRGLRVLRVSGNRIWQVPRILFEIVRLIRIERFDVVHLHMLQATVLGMVAALLTSTKVVMTKHYSPGPSHTGQYSTGRSLIPKFDHFLTLRANKVIAVSQFIKNSLLKQGTPEVLVEVIRNGLDVASFETKLQLSSASELHKDENVFRIGMIGSLTATKDQKFLLEAFVLIHENIRNCELFLIGEGPEIDSLKEQAIIHGIENQVNFLGFRNDAISILSTLDLYVHTSKHESFGIAVLEAMLSEKAVVARGVDAIPEIVVDGETGTLVYGTPTDFAVAVINLLNDPAKRKAYGERSRQRALNNFDILKTVRQYEGVWLDVSRKQKR